MDLLKQTVETAQAIGTTKALGFALTWHNPENKAMCRLYTRQNADFLNEALWPQQFEWLRQRLETMRKVFGPIVKNMKLEAAE